MRILGYIGSYNDGIDRPLQALIDLTYPVSDIVVVDNASETNIFPKNFPRPVSVVRIEKNLGPNSAVATGLQYALDHGYEWFWLVESDGNPHKEALAKLVALYDSFDAETKKRIGIVCSTQILSSSKVFQGRRLTPGGPRLPKIDPNLPYCECDGIMWNGALFNLESVRAVGLPRVGTAGPWEDLSYDYGDMEYSYRIKAAGYKVITHLFSMIEHRVGRPKQLKMLGRPLITTNHPPNRRYLFFRNLTYFWVHIYPRLNWATFGLWFAYRFAVTCLGIVVIERKGIFKKIWACFEGVRDGLAGNLARKY
jgi:rhamnosyltransferase